MHEVRRKRGLFVLPLLSVRSHPTRPNDCRRRPSPARIVREPVAVPQLVSVLERRSLSCSPL